MIDGSQLSWVHFGAWDSSESLYQYFLYFVPVLIQLYQIYFLLKPWKSDKAEVTRNLGIILLV